MLSSSGGKYLVGSKLSLADIGVLEVLISLEDYLKMEPFQKYPHVKVRSTIACYHCDDYACHTCT